MRVTVSSVLPAPIEDCWGLLQHTSTLLFVAEGVMTYDNAATLPDTWEVGQTVNLRPRLWGKSQGDHFVRVVTVDHDNHTIVTNEHGGPITVWNHTMHLVEIRPDVCRYTDTIEIEAGWQTPIVWLFAQYFYRHRHARWQQLIKL